MFHSEDPTSYLNPSDSETFNPGLRDRLLYGEYLQLANELTEQGKNPDTYRLDRWHWFTSRDWHNVCSLIVALVGSLITAVAFNKVIAGVLPLFMRGSWGIVFSLATAILFVWAAEKAFVISFQTYNLGRKLKGMIKVAAQLPSEREAVRREALMPLNAELNRFGGWTWFLLISIGIAVGAVDVSTLYNLLSEFLATDADLTTRLATLGSSFVTLGIILGKAIYEAYYYFIPEQLYRYGQMYAKMAETQEKLCQGMLPVRVDQEYERYRQEIAALHQELEALKQTRVEAETKFRQDIEGLESLRKNEAEDYRRQLEALRNAAHGVISGHSVFADIVRQLGGTTELKSTQSLQTEALMVGNLSNSNNNLV